MTGRDAYPAGTYVVRIEVGADHEIGPGQLLSRVTNALDGKNAPPYRLRYERAQVTFEPVPNADEGAA